MTRSSGPRRTASNLSESIHQQLNMYALAASAAGVGMLALAQPSEARIVYTHVHKVIRPNSHLDIDLNHDGVIDFVIHNVYDLKYPIGTVSVKPSCLPRQLDCPNGLVANPNGFRDWYFAYALKFGAKIGSPEFFGGTLLAQQALYRGAYGYWWNDVTAYMGMRFLDRKERTHYGWARLKVTQINYRYVATLTGYAYETIPNKPIIAGKKKEDAPTNDAESANPVDLGPSASPARLTSDTPQPASLGVLALGAQGVPLWRRRGSAGDTR